MSTTLLLARHGQTIWHAENRYARHQRRRPDGHGGRAGGSPGPLGSSPPGGRDLDVPLSRAVLTAAPACRALNLTPHTEPALRECDFGVVEGRTLAEFETENPEAAEAFRTDPVAHAFPGAEDPTAAATRGATALHRIAAAHPDQRVLVVAHNTLLRLVLCRLLGIPLSEYRRVFPRLRNAAVSELRVQEGTVALLSLNVPCGEEG